MQLHRSFIKTRAHIGAIMQIGAIGSCPSSETNWIFQTDGPYLTRCICSHKWELILQNSSPPVWHVYDLSIIDHHDSGEIWKRSIQSLFGNKIDIFSNIFALKLWSHVHISFLDENLICVKVFDKKLGKARQMSDRPATFEEEVYKVYLGI